MFFNYQKSPFFILAVIVFLFVHTTLFAEQNTDNILHHELIIQSDLNNGQLTVRDTLSVPKQAIATEFSVQLSDKFRVQYANKPLKASSTQAGISTYRISLTAAQQTVTLEYTGKITSTPQCQFTQQICALLNNDGIYLSPALAWYPTTNSGLHTFTMSIKSLPTEWRSLSQGLEKTPNHWQVSKPQNGIYLIAGKFSVYEKKGAIATAQVYLRHDDPALAQQYLATTDYYLNYYQQQLGAYPYAKFATVESFWESGWGMPSFTLLGSRVMRMPFILHTSFPHEILHNWWGNSVYVDASSGNWSEGLTAYLADHGLKEKSGKDSAYRRTALNKYAVFTQGGNDFPITQFRSRHSNATQAIGYSKLLMVYHMLRRQLGDKLFFSSLQQFYRDYQYKYASMNDLIESLYNKYSAGFKTVF